MGGMKLKTGVAALAVSMLLFTADAGAAVSHQVTGPEAKASRGFWTAARVAAALKRDPDSALNAASSPDRHPVATHHRPVTVYRPEVGKILAWDRNIGEFSCSGSIIDTRSLRLVLTAGHCVYADGVWARRHIFIPNFKNGRRPFGAYRVKATWVSNAWFNNSFGTRGMNFDIGLLVTRKRWNGSRIGENVGAIPIQTFPRRYGVTDIYGYPGGAMRTRVMRTCRSHTKADWYGGRFFYGPTGLLARCNMAAGSSGGPWGSRYKAEGGGTIGVVDGLTSTGFSQGGRSYLTSPYFGRILVRLIKATEGR